jgi:hypothetical protein
MKKGRASSDSSRVMKVFLFVVLATVLEATRDAIVRIAEGALHVDAYRFLLIGAISFRTLPTGPIIASGTLIVTGGLIVSLRK